MKTRFLVLALLAFIVCAVSAEGRGEQSAASSGPVVLKWLGTALTGNLDKAIPDDPVSKEITKKTGVVIDWGLNIGMADTATRVAALLAADDLPDIVLPVENKALESSLLKAKAVIPLDDLVKSRGQNFLKNAPKMIAYNKLAKSDETHALYCISPGVGGSNEARDSVSEAWQIRWDLYKKLGYPKITSYEEFLNVLKEMQRLEPENAAGQKNYGLGLFLAESWGERIVDRAMMFEEGFTNGGVLSVYENTNTGEVVPRLTDPNGVYWRSLAFLNKAYLMGVLDPESATLKFQTYMDKAKTGRYFASPEGWMSSGADAEFLTQASGKGYCPILIAPNKNGIYVVSQTEAGNQVDIYISRKSKYPEKAMDLLNYLASWDGSNLIANGVEGLHWKYVNGKPQLIGEALDAVVNHKDITKQSGINKYSWQLRILADPWDPRGFFTNFALNTPGAIQPREIYEDYKTFFKVGYIAEPFQKFPKYKYDYNYFVSVSFDAKSDLAKMDTDINNYVQTHVGKVIFAKSEQEFNDLKAQYIADVKALGADKVVESFKAIYAKLKADMASMNLK